MTTGKSWPSTKLTANDQIVIRRAPYDALLVENPDARGWRTLAEKLNWDPPFASLDMKFDGHIHFNRPRVTVLSTVSAMASMYSDKFRQMLR